MSNARNIASIAGEDVLNASNEIVPVYACRAWVNFDGTLAMTVESSYGPDVPPADYSSPNPIRDSGNVSSIIDLGIGQFVANFTTAMADTNYATQVSCRDETGTGGRLVGNESYSNSAYRGTSSVSIEIFNSNDSALKNSSIVSVCIFR
jgi:hypothetical protein